MSLDSNFSTLDTPSPEDIQAFDLGIKKAVKLGIKYVMASDPDADRVGLCIKNTKDKFKLLTGNELGALLCEYILKSRFDQGALKKNSYIIDTIVTSDLGKKIASKYGVSNQSVLTGFKFIGDLIYRNLKSKEYHFEFAYEESLSFLNNPYILEKDGVGIALVIVEMINYYESKNQSLLEVLNNIYEEYGYYQNKQVSIILEPSYAKERIEVIMNHFRNGDLVDIANHKISAIADYESQSYYTKGKQEKIDLPKTNALKIWLSNGSWIAIRPSGTEPKMKFYLSSVAETLVIAQNQIIELQNFINETLEELFI
ncbi:MAG: phospho-sugar mutase, partial [Bacilli bacterium]